MTNDAMLSALNNLTIMDLDDVFRSALSIMRCEGWEDVPASTALKVAIILLDDTPKSN